MAKVPDMRLIVLKQLARQNSVIIILDPTTALSMTDSCVRGIRKAGWTRVISTREDRWPVLLTKVLGC